MGCFKHEHMPSKVLAFAGGISLVRTTLPDAGLDRQKRQPVPAFPRTHHTAVSCRRADVLSDHSAAVRLSLAPVDNHLMPYGLASLQIPALVDFMPMTIDVASAPELDGVVPGPIYPLFGLVTGALALFGGLKGVRRPPCPLDVSTQARVCTTNAATGLVYSRAIQGIPAVQAARAS